MNKLKLSILLFLLTQSVLAHDFMSESQKLAITAKVWGFLKYHHPMVASGKFNWDKELIEMLPKIRVADNREELSNVYLSLLERLGKPKEYKKRKIKGEYFLKNYEMSWLENEEFFTRELSEHLKYIEENKNRGKNFYLTTTSADQVVPFHEASCPDHEYPSEAYRLLGLFRYWNYIEYYFPYKYLCDQKWDEALVELIPEFTEASHQEEYRMAIQKLVAKTDDSHSFVFFEKKMKKCLPVAVTLVEEKPVICEFTHDSIAKKNGFQLGDIILEIEGENLQEAFLEKSSLIPASNDIKEKNKIIQSVCYGVKKDISVLVQREDEILELEVQRYSFKELVEDQKTILSPFKMLSDSIAYLTMDNLKGKELKSIFSRLKTVRKLIIDLRNYPNFIYKDFSSYLNSEKKPFIRYYLPKIDHPGKFKLFGNLRTGGRKRTFEGEIALLVNERTISRAEFTAMAIQTAENVTTIGSQTAGADGDVFRLEYLGGYTTGLTGAMVCYPDGTETQRKGIKIDVEVKPSIKGIREGRDEVLEKAIEFLSK